MQGPGKAIIGRKGVQYGLSLPKRQQAEEKSKPLKPALPFSGADDSDEEDVEQSVARQAAKKASNKKVQDMYQKALEEDPNAFAYDEVYDGIQAARVKTSTADKTQRQSRYVAGLLETAERRKRENDVVMDRMIAKEQAKEDHLYEDKEKFVTAAYRKKLEEDKKWKEMERKKEEEEERNAVEKRGHMGDFYRNLFRNNEAFGTAGTEGEAGAKLHPAQEDGSEQVERSEAAMKGEAAEEAGQQSAYERRRAEAERALRTAGARAQPASAPAEPEEGVTAAEQTTREAAAETAAPEKGSGPAATAAAGRRNDDATVAAARARYLARKRKAGAG